MKRMTRPHGGASPVQSEIMARLAAAAQVVESAPTITALVSQGVASISTTGMVIHNEISEDAWKLLYVDIQRFKKAFQWIIGDWMLYGGERGWVDTYEQMADLTGLKAVTVRNYTYVCRNIVPSLRSDELSFGHFQTIAAVPDEDKQRWIDEATHDELSVRGLSKKIQEHYSLPIEPVAALPSQDTLTDKEKRKPFNRIFTNLSRGTPERIHKTDFAAVRDWLNKAERYIESQNVKLKK